MRCTSILIAVTGTLAVLTAAVTTEKALQSAADAAAAVNEACVDVLLGDSTSQADMDALIHNLIKEANDIQTTLSTISKNGNLEPATPSCAAALEALKHYFRRERAQGFCMQGITCTRLAQRFDKASGAYNYDTVGNLLKRLNTDVPFVYRLLIFDCAGTKAFHHAYIAAYNQTQLAIDRLNPQLSPDACEVPSGEGPPLSSNA